MSKGIKVDRERREGAWAVGVASAWIASSVNAFNWPSKGFGQINLNWFWLVPS